MKQHKKPCGECPFRTASAPGWLGADTPEHFELTAQSDCRMPCHTQVDYGRRDWADQIRNVPRCAGRAAYLANQCKMPRDADEAALVRAVGRRDDVFPGRAAFLAHHGPKGR